jgi:hypothetical protein
MTFPVGTDVIVKHGVSGWLGTVTSSQPGYIVVTYPNGNRPNDGKPAREMVNLSRRKVVTA